MESSGNQAGGGSDSGDDGNDSGAGDDENKEDSVGTKRIKPKSKEDDFVEKLKSKKSYTRREKKETKKTNMMSSSSKLPRDNTELGAPVEFVPTINKKEDEPALERTDTKGFELFPQIQ